MAAVDESTTPAPGSVGSFLPEASALAAVDDAARAIAGIRSVDDVLQVIVDRVRSLVDAEYAALGIVGIDGRIERFITAGIDPHRRALIGSPPRGRGLLGLIIREGRSYRIPSIADHGDSFGFPPNHPPMTSFLGVPVTSKGAAIGNLYLTDKHGAAEFSATDQALVELFARHAAIAIENARLHAQAGRLAVAEERDRIGRDLHDGIIQSLYAVGLSLEDVPELMADEQDEAVARVDGAIEAINLAIRDIRNFIYGLRPEAVDGTQVLAGLAALAEEVRHGGLVDVETELDAAADPDLDEAGGAEILNLVREALSNAVRHGRAARILMTLTVVDGTPTLEIADDGIGFDVSREVPPGHHGLANMRARASAVGGRFEVRSSPGSGSRVIVELPIAGEIEDTGQDR